jgi:Zn-dependent protease with chaperone function
MARRPAAVVGLAIGVWVSASAWAGAESKGELKGPAEFHKGAVLVVDGRRVRVGPATRTKGVPAGQEIPLGRQVKAEGTWLRDGALEARQIEVKPDKQDSSKEELLTKCSDLEQLYVESGRVLRMGPNGVVDLGALSRDGKAYERARRTLDRLLPPYLAPAAARLYIVDNADWNAFAMANFAIYVHSGLLQDLDDDEVSIVLGHELAHATLEHTRQTLHKSRWARLARGITFVGGEVLGGIGGLAVRDLGGLGASALNNGFSRAFEDQADRVGLRYAFEGGFAVQKAPALWRRFAEKYRDRSGVGSFLFGSHSRSADRARNLESELARNYAPDVDEPSKKVPPPKK